MLVVIGRKKQDLRDRIDHPAVDPFFVEGWLTLTKVK
jgi:hypothetical protein